MAKATIVGSACNIKPFEKGINFSVRTTQKKGEEWQGKFWNCTAFGKTAELIEKTLKQKNTICVNGNLTQDEYQDKTYVKILVESFVICDGTSDNETNGDTKTAFDASVDQNTGEVYDNEVPF